MLLHELSRLHRATLLKRVGKLREVRFVGSIVGKRIFP
jgi:hypothetical protein